MISNNDYNILLTFQKNNCINEKSAFTIKEINKNTNISVSTIRKTLMLLFKLQYIDNGFQHWKASSYFITEKGINYIIKIQEVI